MTDENKLIEEYTLGDLLKIMKRKSPEELNELKEQIKILMQKEKQRERVQE